MWLISPRKRMNEFCRAQKFQVIVALANREASITAGVKYKREPGRIRYVSNGVGEQFVAERNYAGHDILVFPALGGRNAAFPA